MGLDILGLKKEALKSANKLLFEECREVFAILKSNKYGPVKISKFLKDKADLDIKPHEIYTYLKYHPLSVEKMQKANKYICYFKLKKRIPS